MPIKNLSKVFDRSVYALTELLFWLMRECERLCVYGSGHLSSADEKEHSIEPRNGS